MNMQGLKVARVPLVTPDPRLPNPDNLLAFNVAEKKEEIFRYARTAIRNKAQYTRSGRQPWTQITVSLPLYASDSTDDEDLSIVWALMRDSTTQEVGENASGDLTWKLWGRQYMEWLEKDPENIKPVDLYVHPVKYETGARKKTILQNKIKKARASYNTADELIRFEQELENHQNNPKPQEEGPRGHHYHWSSYGDCHVIYRKRQPKKAELNEIQLTIKIRTFYLGNGVPEENNGYLQGCNGSPKGLLDPNSDLYSLMLSIHPY